MSSRIYLGKGAISLSLPGPQAALGAAIHSGIFVAFQNINRNRRIGRRPVNLLPRGNQGRRARADTHVTTLADGRV